MKKIYGIVLVLSILVGFSVYNYIYKDHRDINAENPEFTIDSNVIKKEFTEDYQGAESKYLNKTIIISGVLTEINRKDITLDNIFFCNLNEGEIVKFKIKDTVTVKGRCIGYDDLLEQVKLDQCSFKN